MPTTDLHGNNNQFGNDSKLSGKGRVDVIVTERETDGSISGDDFEKNSKHGEGDIVRILETWAFGDSDYKQTKKYEPQIKPQLTAQMSANIARLFVVLLFLGSGSVDPKTSFFIDICTANGNSNGKGGYVHHNKIRYLYCRMEVGKINCRCASCPSRSRLEYTVKDSEAGRIDRCNGRVMKLYLFSVRRESPSRGTHIKNNKKDSVNHVEKKQNPKEPPSRRAREQKGEASSGMVEEKLELFPKGMIAGRNLGPEPDSEAKHAWESSIADYDEKGTEQKWPNRCLK